MIPSQMLPQYVWPSGLLWLRVLPAACLLLQYPLTAILLLAWNQDSLQQGNRLVACLRVAWAALVLSSTVWLVDMAAVCTLLSSAVEAVVRDLPRHSWRSWRRWLGLAILVVSDLLLPMQLLLLHCVLPIVRALSCSRAVDVMLRPTAGAEEVWAENQMYSRMPMEALMESVEQLTLQVSDLPHRPSPQCCCQLHVWGGVREAVA